MEYDPFCVHYTVITGSKDQRLNLSIDRYSHTHTHTHIYIYIVGLFTNVFYVFAVYFYKKFVKCQSKM